jgi:hypothetical protein
MEDKDQQRLDRLRKRFPKKSEKELLEIRHFLDRYFEIALEIYLS